MNFKEHYSYIQQIWNNKDIALICGRNVFKNIQYNIFNTARSIEYIYAPTTDAFNTYNTIIQEAKKINKNKLILLILGPTATILAYDLTQLGYRALDIGHLAKDYDAYKKNIPATQETIRTFFSPD